MLYALKPAPTAKCKASLISVKPCPFLAGPPPLTPNPHFITVARLEACAYNTLAERWVLLFIRSLRQLPLCCTAKSDPRGPSLPAVPPVCCAVVFPPVPAPF